MILRREYLAARPPKKQEQDGEEIPLANYADDDKRKEHIDAHQAAPPSCIQQGR